MLQVEFPLHSLGGTEANYLPVEVANGLENRIVVVGPGLIADKTVECSADFACIDVFRFHQSSEKI